jgi:hypothetical protein
MIEVEQDRAVVREMCLVLLRAGECVRPNWAQSKAQAAFRPFCGIQL